MKSIKDYQSKYDKKRLRLAVSLHPVKDLDIINYVTELNFSGYVKDLIRSDIKSYDVMSQLDQNIIKTIRNKLLSWCINKTGSALIGLRSDIIFRMNLNDSLESVEFVNSLPDSFLNSLIK